MRATCVLSFPYLNSIEYTHSGVEITNISIHRYRCIHSYSHTLGPPPLPLLPHSLLQTGVHPSKSLSPSLSFGATKSARNSRPLETVRSESSRRRFNKTLMFLRKRKKVYGHNGELSRNYKKKREGKRTR